MFIHSNLTAYIETFFSNFISAYRESYSPNHACLHETNRKLEEITRTK